MKYPKVGQTIRGKGTVVQLLSQNGNTFALTVGNLGYSTFFVHPVTGELRNENLYGKTDSLLGLREAIHNLEWRTELEFSDE